jgi:23S rRNA pseudouridine2605 synthase
VRRLFEAVGHAVSRLIRIRYGAMVLPRGLKRGAWMELDEGDIHALTRAAGVPDLARPERGQPPGEGQGWRAQQAPRRQSWRRAAAQGGPPARQGNAQGQGRARAGASPAAAVVVVVGPAAAAASRTR